MTTQVETPHGREAHSATVEALDAHGVGKRLPDAVYLHASALDSLTSEAQRYLRRLAATPGPGGDLRWTVAKVHLDKPRVSLLDYPDFDTDPFPTLRAWAVVDCDGRIVRRESVPAEDAPVLHRKELLLAPGDSRSREWAALTAQAEELGLFEHPSQIGRSRAWAALLRARGLQVVRGCLVEHNDTEGSILRYRTALVRHALSTPVRTLFEHELLTAGQTFFDYGCGRGDDLRFARELGADASGWDPHFATGTDLRAADAVNLGFVLNVIEDPSERQTALRTAWGLATRVLVVGVLVAGRSAWEKHRLFRDGVVTSRGTFQKHFTQEEVCAFVGAVSGRDPIAMAPGIVLVFRRDEDEQEFLARRQARKQRRPALARVVAAPRATRPSRAAAIADATVEDVWRLILELGRPPEDEELDTLPKLVRGARRLRECIAVATSRFGPDALATARLGRQEDLLVYLALAQFDRRKSSRGRSKRLRRDLRVFFDGEGEAEAAAKILLFSAGSSAAIRDRAFASAAAIPEASLGAKILDLRAADILRADPLIRVFVGCAAKLYGVGGSDIIRVHLDWPMVSLLSYDDLEAEALPRLIERIRIDLRRQQVRIEVPEHCSVLCRRSHFMGPGHARQEQAALEQTLRDRGVVSSIWEHTPLDLIRQRLSALGVALCGNSLAEVARDGRWGETEPVTGS